MLYVTGVYLRHITHFFHFFAPECESPQHFALLVLIAAIPNGHRRDGVSVSGGQR